MNGVRRSKSDQPYVRVQLDMTPRQVEQVDRLCRDAALRSRRELFDHALTLFEWAVAESGKGNRIAAVHSDSGEYDAVILPSLAAASRSRDAVPASKGVARRRRLKRIP